MLVKLKRPYESLAPSSSSLTPEPAPPSLLLPGLPSDLPDFDFFAFGATNEPPKLREPRHPSDPLDHPAPVMI